MLEVKDLKTELSTQRGIIRAVDGVNLRINESERVALVGESGCGKTMTALSIIRLVPDPPGKITSGEIQFKGINLLERTNHEMTELRGKEISMVFQDPMTFLNPLMKIGDQIAEGVRIHQKIGKNQALERAVETLRSVSIPAPDKVCSYYPHQLSGGMRQRVLIAIALACDPVFVILDEPTTALDVTTQSQILRLTSDLTKKLSLLLITHDLGIVGYLADVVYVMYVGKIVEHGDVFSIYEEPAHPYTQGLLNSVLSIDEFKKTLETIGGMVPDALNPPGGCRFHPRCTRVLDICRSKEPPEVQVGQDHFVSCWLYK